MTVGNLSVGSVKTIGSAHKRYMVVPGEATLELNDDEWRNEFAVPAAKLVEAGNLEITEAPAMTEEEQAKADAKSLAEAKKLLARNTVTKKATKKVAEVKTETK